MISVNEAVIARLRKGNEMFEVLVDCEKAIDFKHGKGDLEDCLAGEMIFKDSKKGFKASEHEMDKIFGTSDVKTVAEKIIKEGEIQLTLEYRTKLREDKKRKIINMITRNAINPQNNLPHPQDRIERAMNEAKVNIDEFKRAEDQVNDIVKKVSGILPIKLETREVQIIIPSKFAGQAYGILKNKGNIMKDEWMNDGSLNAVLEIPAGLQEELESDLNKLTHGDINIQILKRK